MTKRITITIDEDTAAWLRAEAKRSGHAVGGIVDGAVRAVREADGDPPVRRALARKLGASAQARALAAEHPELSESEIAEKLGVSRQLVHGALRADGTMGRPRARPRCARCRGTGDEPESIG
jgi:hypothetical protein